MIIFTNIGLSSIIITYSLPIFYFAIKENIYKIKIKIFVNVLAKIRANSLAIVLFYFFYSTTLLSILASLFSAIPFDNAITIVNLEFFRIVTGNFSIFTKQITIAGYLMMLFTVLLFILSYLIELMFRRLSSFELFLGGYTDNNTGLTNISLKYDTFIDLVNNINEEKSEEISKKIGQDFGKVLVEKYKISSLDELKARWLETDEKSGFLENIDFGRIDNKELLTSINIDKSFSKRIKNEDDKEYSAVCEFLKNYSTGIIEAYFNFNKINKTVSLNVIDDVCVNCLSNEQCAFKVEATKHI